ncbi:hypothetical protein LOC68_16275 [Blastopirellula sp. JC732]|uniref:Uncharacterized protein n=1 Tax=Blastopirellula sediminis TaxID=2894196 RepID=A0A9X1MNK0_9BACT|nr:hypothetical protein [Blastopirellula sediminis]MCC9606754.1 hypothetical protein [Blastopirellula sediminis]MCC9629949.1 hypothetical protein [Blastopirellula sediminis]
MTPEESEQNPPPRRRRNWRSFGLKTLFVLVTIAAIVAAYPHFYRRYQIHKLKSFVDQDVRQLEEDKRNELRRVVNILIDRPIYGWYDRSQYWRVWRIPTPDGFRFVLLRVFPRENQNTNTVKICILNDNCRMVNESEFDTGNSITLRNATLDYDQFPEQPIIQFHMMHFSDGQAVATEYYSILDGQVALLRLEDRDGELISYPVANVGPPAIEKSEAEWKESLSSPHLPEVLSTLAWLGESYSHSGAANDENTPLPSRVKTDPATQAAIAKLAKHEHPWIAEAALYLVHENELEDKPLTSSQPIEK